MPVLFHPLPMPNPHQFLRWTLFVPDTMLVSHKVNSTTIHASLIHKNGLIYTFLSAFPIKKFKDLLTAEFVYGFLDIVISETPDKQALKTQHLMSLMRLASKYRWNTVLSFHIAVLDRIEAGLTD